MPEKSCRDCHYHSQDTSPFIKYDDWVHYMKQLCIGSELHLCEKPSWNIHLLLMRRKQRFIHNKKVKCKFCDLWLHKHRVRIFKTLCMKLHSLKGAADQKLSYKSRHYRPLQTYKKCSSEMKLWFPQVVHCLKMQSAVATTEQMD